MLLKQLNALEKEMIVYKAPQEKHVITVFTDITCGYCHKLHEQMADHNAGDHRVILLSRAVGWTAMQRKKYVLSGVRKIKQSV